LDGFALIDIGWVDYFMCVGEDEAGAWDQVR